jgi:biopolymer transport protein ExbD
MRFIVRKRRQAPAVIIVALIDILIVLVIFLVVTTTFKQQPAISLALPESSQAKESGAREDAPLVVSIDPQGNLRFGENAMPVTVDRLKQELGTAVAGKPGAKLAINADKQAPFGQIVKVMDAAREAGIKAIVAHTKEPAKQ